MRIAVRLALAFVLIASSRAAAWGTKEHIQLTRLAVSRLLDDPATPAGMKAWLKEAAPNLPDREGEKQFFLTRRMGVFPRGVDGLAYWSVMPDLVSSNDNIAPFGAPERLLHFIDLEFFAPEDKRTYADDLSHKPSADAIPRDLKDPRWVRAGMLPFRVEDCYAKLVRCLQNGKVNDKPGQFPRDDHAVRWAGYLAHYAADNTQPHHATLDYKSASYFDNRRTAPNIHAELEYRMGDDDRNDFPELRKEYWAAFEKALGEFKDPIMTKDPWQATIEIALASYDALPLIGRAAQAAGRGEKFDTEPFFRFKGQFAGVETTVLEMKARQQAWAVQRIATLWRQAWEEAHP